MQEWVNSCDSSTQFKWLHKKYLSLTTALHAVVEVVSLFGGVDSGTSVVC
jgi:hypothetical protein